MAKTVEEICNKMAKQYTLKMSAGVSMPIVGPKTLASTVSCISPKKNNPYSALFENENLYDNLERKITEELAAAIDNNSVDRIKYLKNKYGHLAEFKSAKEFLNKKCKEVWNVYEDLNKVPKEAMKSLGITNQPDLDFILGNSLKYYEQGESKSTSYIIESTLKNKNLSYTIDDIHKYLKETAKKSECKFNFYTVKYFIENQNYSKEKLLDLGVEKEVLQQVFKKLSLKQKIKYLCKQCKAIPNS